MKKVIIATFPIKCKPLPLPDEDFSDSFLDDNINTGKILKSKKIKLKMKSMQSFKKK